MSSGWILLTIVCLSENDNENVNENEVKMKSSWVELNWPAGMRSSNHKQTVGHKYIILLAIIKVIINRLILLL